MQEGMTYEQALERLEKITGEMERGQIGVDLLAERLQEARKLLDYCRQRLTIAEKSCNTMLADIDESHEN